MKLGTRGGGGVGVGGGGGGACNTLLSGFDFLLFNVIWG